MSNQLLFINLATVRADDFQCRHIAKPSTLAASVNPSIYMIDFKDNIVKKADSLISKAKSLPGIHFEWQEPVEINCSEIDNFQFGIAEIQFERLKNNRHFPAIYYFKLLDNSDNTQIINALDGFRGLKVRSCPKIDRRRSTDSDFLYCGSVRNNLHGRVIQHLGNGHKDTYALQLKHWACKLELRLALHHALVDKEFVDFTELIESALADYLTPLVGKLA